MQNLQIITNKIVSFCLTLIVDCNLMLNLLIIIEK